LLVEEIDCIVMIVAELSKEITENNLHKLRMINNELLNASKRTLIEITHTQIDK